MADGVVRGPEGGVRREHHYALQRHHHRCYYAGSIFGSILLQDLRSSHIEAYYAAATVANATLALHHAILHKALRKAKKEGLVARNVADDLDDTPQSNRTERNDAQIHCWSTLEARRFLEVAKAAWTPAGGVLYAGARFWRPQGRTVRAGLVGARPGRRHDGDHAGSC